MLNKQLCRILLPSLVVSLFLESGLVNARADITKLADLPVRDVTVFKDGHAFVTHRGMAATDENGQVHIDHLPTPVVGTFWPFSGDPQVALHGVTVGQRRVVINKTALTLAELIRANVGARIIVHESPERSWAGQILGIPERTSEELSSTLPSSSGPQPTSRSLLVLLKTDEGVKVTPVSKILEVTFIDPPRTKVADDELRNVMTFHMDWQGAPVEKQADVGMTYLQRGLRWIPQYRITLQPDGQAVVELQATLINELIDLTDVRTHLVIGVPRFDFKGTIDPIALNQQLANLSQYFRENNRPNTMMFNNSAMTLTQVRSLPTPHANEGEPGGNLGPGLAEGQESDLFIFTLEHVSLAKGERMAVSLGRWQLPYEDLFRLTIDDLPPPELRKQFDSRQQAELAKMVHAPKVKHIVRIHNQSDVPFTTAPVIFLKQGNLMAQGMMTYTSSGNRVDLEITTAVNVPVSLTDEVSERTPNSATFGGHQYDRIGLAGKISLTNYHDRPVVIEVERRLLGIAEKASSDGKIVRTNPNLSTSGNQPFWWNWSTWPYWWFHLNTSSSVRWKVTLPAGQKLELSYQWHYFWRS